MTGLVIFLTGSVSEAAVLRARSVSLEKQADAEWHDGLFAGIKGKGANASVHGQGVTASVKDLLAGIEGPRGMSPEVDNMFHLLQATQKGTPMKDLLDIVNPEIDKMEKQILDAKTSAQHALDGIDVSFTKCKTNKRVGEGEADGLQSTMNGKRQPHKDCRGFESSDKIEYDSCGKTMDALKTTMNLACDEYNKAVKAPNVNLVPAQNGNEDYKLWLGRVKTWVDDELSSVTRKEAACNTAKSNYDNEKERCEGLSGDGGLKKAWEDKKTQCDEAQTAFETAACEYFSKVEATCSAYETCVAATKTVYDNQRPHIEKEEKDRETEYRAVQRIKCLLDVWGAQGDSVDKAKLQECVDKTHSTSHLEVSYPTPPEVPSCALPERPCTTGPTGFVTAEYGGLPAHAPNKACTPCAGAASSNVTATTATTVAPSYVAGTSTPTMATPTTPWTVQHRPLQYSTTRYLLENAQTFDIGNSYKHVYLSQDIRGGVANNQWGGHPDTWMVLKLDTACTVQRIQIKPSGKGGFLSRYCVREAKIGVSSSATTFDSMTTVSFPCDNDAGQVGCDGSCNPDGSCDNLFEGYYDMLAAPTFGQYIKIDMTKYCTLGAGISYIGVVCAAR